MGPVLLNLNDISIPNGFFQYRQGLGFSAIHVFFLARASGLVFVQTVIHPDQFRETFIPKLTIEVSFFYDWATHDSSHWASAPWANAKRQIPGHLFDFKIRIALTIWVFLIVSV
jgi:hypothetical protein